MTFLWKFSIFFPSFLIFFFQLVNFPFTKNSSRFAGFQFVNGQFRFLYYYTSVLLTPYHLVCFKCAGIDCEVLGIYLLVFVTSRIFQIHFCVSAFWIMQVQVDGLLFQSIQVKELSSIQHIYTQFACSLFDIVWYSCWLSSSFYSKKMSLIKISGLENAWNSRILLQLYLILICMKYGTQTSKNILLYVLKTNLWFEFETSACYVGTIWFWCYISGSCWNDHCPPVYLLLI